MCVFKCMDTWHICMECNMAFDMYMVFNMVFDNGMLHGINIMYKHGICRKY